MKKIYKRKEYFNGDIDEYNNALDYLLYALTNSYKPFLATLGSTQLRIINSQY